MREKKGKIVSCEMMSKNLEVSSLNCGIKRKRKDYDLKNRVDAVESITYFFF